MKKVVFLLALLLIFCFSGCAETDTAQQNSDVENASNTGKTAQMQIGLSLNNNIFG